MSSTEGTRVQEALGQFFTDVLAPLAGRMAARGDSAFPLGPDAACSTYFVPRPQPAMERRDFLAPSCLDADEFERGLAAHWQALGRGELLGEVPRVRALAEGAREARRLAQESPELSPDLYVMF